MNETFAFMYEFMADMGYSHYSEMYDRPLGEFAAYVTGRLHKSYDPGVVDESEDDIYRWEDNDVEENLDLDF